jgi:hypothetical protein
MLDGTTSASAAAAAAAAAAAGAGAAAAKDEPAPPRRVRLRSGFVLHARAFCASLNAIDAAVESLFASRIRVTAFAVLIGASDSSPTEAFLFQGEICLTEGGAADEASEPEGARRKRSVAIARRLLGVAIPLAMDKAPRPPPPSAMHILARLSLAGHGHEHEHEHDGDAPEGWAVLHTFDEARAFRRSRVFKVIASPEGGAEQAVAAAAAAPPPEGESQAEGEQAAVWIKCSAALRALRSLPDRGM